MLFYSTLEIEDETGRISEQTLPIDAPCPQSAVDQLLRHLHGKTKKYIRRVVSMPRPVAMPECVIPPL